jgi:transposase
MIGFKEFTMSRRARRTFTDEFKADVVRLCQQGDRSVVQIARDLDLLFASVREWVRQAEANGVVGAEAPLSSSEREELRLARKRIKVLEMERAIKGNSLKKAAAFFARETS